MIQFFVKHGRVIAACVVACTIASPVARAQKPPAAPPVPPPARSGSHAGSHPHRRGDKLGYRADVRPFSFTDNARQPTGYAVALCQRVAGAVKAAPGFGNIAVEWKAVTSDKRFTALRQGDIDLYCGPDAITLAARREIAFSVPVFPGGVGALLRADAPARLREGAGRDARKPAVHSGARALRRPSSQGFSVVRGSATEKWLASRMQDLNVSAKIGPVTALDAGVQSVLTGNADVYFSERSVAAGRRQADEASPVNSWCSIACSPTRRWRWRSGAVTTTSGCSWIGRSAASTPPARSTASTRSGSASPTGARRRSSCGTRCPIDR